MFQLQEREAAEQDLHRKLLFPNLSTLQIGFNQLDSLPEEIGELKSLKVLSLKKNSQLKEVNISKLVLSCNSSNGTCTVIFLHF